MGATLYHLLTNESAYQFRPDTDPLITILEAEIVPVRARRSAVPASIAHVAERAMRKDPEQRFTSADEMRSALLAASR
jgi:serine/threonine-protein kinase